MIETICLGVSIFILAILSCFFSGCETAITSIKSYQWFASDKSSKNAFINKCVSTMLDHYSLTLGSTLIGNTLSNIVCSSLVTVLINNLIGEIYIALGTGLLALFVLIFCEYLPKSISRKYPIKWLNYFAFFMVIFYYLFWPFCIIFNYIFERDKSITATEKDINYLIKTVQHEGVLEQDEASLVQKAMQFDETIIDSIMVKKFVYVNLSDSIDKIKNKFIETNYSRLPVLNSKKNAIGFILSKDILRFFVNRKDEKFEIKKFIKHINFVLSTSYLNHALRTMQRTNSHILGVVKIRNSKKIIGIVTMEMVIEQLVGQIYDEKDQVNKIQIINDFTWIVDPDANAAKFLKIYFKKKIKNTEITIDTYFKRMFKFKHITKNAVFKNKYMNITVVKSQKGNKLKYEITKK